MVPTTNGQYNCSYIIIDAPRTQDDTFPKVFAGASIPSLVLVGGNSGRRDFLFLLPFLKFKIW